MWPWKFSIPLNLTLRGNEMAPTAETNMDAIRMYSMPVFRSLSLTFHSEFWLSHTAPVHSTVPWMCLRISNLSTVSSISIVRICLVMDSCALHSCHLAQCLHWRISACSHSCFDQFGFRLKL